MGASIAKLSAVIELQPVGAFHGPSPVDPEPVVVVEMLAPAEQYLRLAAAVPALQAATSDWYRAGAAPDRTPPAQAVATFLADWALQALTYVNGYLHAAGGLADQASGRTLVWVGFHDPQVSLAAVDLAARWLAALADGAPANDWPARLDDLWARCRHRHPDYQARIVMEAARARGVPYAPAGGLPGYWRYGQGVRSRVLFESSSCDDSRVGSWVSQSKALTKQVLQAMGIPVPASRLVEDISQLEQAVAEIGFPCVTKPIDQGCGRGVTSGLTDMAAVRAGYSAARAHTAGPVMVESHLHGDDHRLMVVDGRFVAAMRREAPVVTGDGRSTIAELVAAKNTGRDGRSLVRSGYLRPVSLDASAVLHLAGLGLHPDSVPAEGDTIRVRSNANLSTGGDCVDVTAQVHPDVRLLVEAIARTLNVAMAGIDFVTTDIAQSPADTGGRFIEVNIVPGLEVPIAAGWSVERAGALALGHTPGRIPLRLLVIPDHAWDRTLHSMRSWRWVHTRGWAGWDQAAHGGVELSVIGGGAWSGVHTLLSHRNLARAVVIATDRQLYEYGLPADRFVSARVVGDLDPLWLPVLQRCCEVVEGPGPAGPADALFDVLQALQ